MVFYEKKIILCEFIKLLAFFLFSNVFLLSKVTAFAPSFIVKSVQCKIIPKVWHENCVTVRSFPFAHFVLQRNVFHVNVLSLELAEGGVFTFVWGVRSSWLRRKTGLRTHVLLSNLANLQLETLLVWENVAVTNLRKNNKKLTWKITSWESLAYLKAISSLSRWEHSMFLEQLHHQLTSLFQYFSVTFFVCFRRCCSLRWRLWRSWRSIRVVFSSKHSVDAI